MLIKLITYYCIYLDTIPNYCLMTSFCPKNTPQLQIDCSLATNLHSVSGIDDVAMALIYINDSSNNMTISSFKANL